MILRGLDTRLKNEGYFILEVSSAQLSAAQIAMIDEVSKPALNFPEDINAHLSPSFIFAGATSVAAAQHKQRSALM